MKKISIFCSAVTLMLMMFAMSSFAQATKLTDPEIASVAVTANQVDIDYAKIATSKSKNDQVLNFAKTMMADHQSVIDQAVALAKKLNVTPKDNDISKKLMSDGEATKKMLNAKSAKDFDNAYI